MTGSAGVVVLLAVVAIPFAGVGLAVLCVGAARVCRFCSRNRRTP